MDGVMTLSHKSDTSLTGVTVEGNEWQLTSCTDCVCEHMCEGVIEDRLCSDFFQLTC